MGLLDSIGAIAGQFSSNSTDPKMVLLKGLAGMLANGSTQGGLSGVMDQLRNAGLGQALDSWISTGANLPVSADQIRAALGHTSIGQLADQAGVSHDEAAQHLSDLLPQLINQLTPNGSVPAGGVTDNHLGSLLGGLAASFLNKPA